MQPIPSLAHVRSRNDGRNSSQQSYEWPRNLILHLLRSSQQTSPPSSNKTGLLTLGGVSRDCRSFTNMLMVTTTVRLTHGLANECPSRARNLLTWSTGFMATPRVLGQELRLTANLCFARDASVRKMSAAHSHLNLLPSTYSA